MFEFKFKMGDELKDTLTGFSGIVVARSQYLTGCNRYSLQKQKLTKEGRPEKWESFDEDMLIKISGGINLKKKKKQEGGVHQMEASDMKQK